MGCLAGAVRAVVVVVGTWLGLALTLLLLLVLSLIPGGRQQNNLATLLVGRWMLAMFVGPIVVGFVWITGGPDVRPGGPPRSSGRRGGYGGRR
jgi:hypothetical protein